MSGCLAASTSANRETLPPEAKPNWNDSGWNSTGGGILITRLGKALYASVSKLDFKACSQVPADSAAPDITEYLVRRHKRVEEHTEKGIEEKNRYRGRLRELHGASIEADATYHIGAYLTGTTQPQLRIYRE
jgi:hypothetical protein